MWRAMLVCIGVLVALCAGGFYWVTFRMFAPAQRYEKGLTGWPQELVGAFPKAIPAGATGVRLDAPAGFGPNHTFAVRFVVSAAQARDLITKAQSVQTPGRSMDSMDIARVFESLPIIDDQDLSTPLPGGFVFVQFAGIKDMEGYSAFAGNPKTGEVVYWAAIH
jgi:hypothetical protein